MTFPTFRKIQTANRLSLLRSLRIGIDRLVLTGLARIYKFDPWHAQAPASARAYRRTVAHVVNELKPATVVEVGCGLGYVLALIHAPQRYVYDVDEGVIRAARLLHGRRIAFPHGDLLSVSLAHIDVLILVNWIHEISAKRPEGLMAPLLPRTRFLLLDAIDPQASSGYRYKHDFAFLLPHARRLSVTRPLDEDRSFHLFRIIS